MNDHLGVVSIVPIFVAIVVAVFTRKVILALFLGVFVGVLTLRGGSPLLATTSLVSDYLVVQLTDSYNVTVLVLLMFIGGFVRLMERSGGAQAFAESARRVIHSRKAVITTSWLGGIAIFFSDLGTPLIVGPVFEPLYDRYRVCREKLAWVLDGTASPVAVLVPITGWAVYIMGLLAIELEVRDVAFSDWELFLAATELNFVPVLTVLSIPVLTWLSWDFGPMASAESRAANGVVHGAGANPLRRSAQTDSENSHVILVWLPLVVLFVTLVGLLVPRGFPFGPVPGSAFRTALSTGYFFGAVSLGLLMVFIARRSFDEVYRLYLEGIQNMVVVAAILVLAWMLGQVSRELGTADYVVEISRASVDAPWIPAIIFISACLMSFATGSSWGSFAILFPLVVPLADAMAVSLPVAVAAVLSGGLFGDHASPISDTTILASTGAGCDHIDHTRTQLPYAVAVAIAALSGFVMAGYGGGVWSWIVVSVVWLALMTGLRLWYPGERALVDEPRASEA